MTRRPIGPSDIVSVKGRHLVRTDGSRFMLQGIAFPIAVTHSGAYDLVGWNKVLDQLANETDINAVRMYEMVCNRNYSSFLNHAAELGIYVIVPLTSSFGGGVLDRNKIGPECYPRHLYDYGTACLDLLMQYPNVVAGIIGNEVMNSVKTWLAAPCVKAYTRDLKRYMQKNNMRSLPLVYAAQHDSITAEILPHEAIKFTLDYLSCGDQGGIDIFGVNIESWCSSLQTFELDENGVTESTYYTLWQTLQNTSIPLLFTEIGCSKSLYNRDNGLQKGARDWAQIPVVLDDMADIFSGFCAYTYYGNPVFGMMALHTAWDGHSVLEPSLDFYNFRDQLHTAQVGLEFGLPPKIPSPDRPFCRDAMEQLQLACVDCDFNFTPIENMPS